MPLSTTLTAWCLALGFAAIRLVVVGQLQLAPDEAYYWEWSRTLDWCYYDQGPVLALVIRLGTAVLGANESGVRIASVVCGLGVSACYIWMAQRLGRPALAPWLVLAANAMLLFSVGAVLMMHDSLLGLFWALALFAALKAVLDDGRWWLLAGLASGVACLSKYSGVLLPLSLLLACLTHASLRPHLKRPWIWLGALAGGVLAGFPILGWNLAHGWPSFQHVGSLAGGDGSRRSWASLPEFLGSQVGLVTPLLLALIGLAWLALWRRRRDVEAWRWLLGCASAPVFLLFLALSLRSRVEGNWSAPAYIAALPLAALWLDDAGRLWGRASRWALGLAFVFTLLAHGQALWPFMPLPEAQAAHLDSTARLDGWASLAERVQAERARLPQAAFVGCRSYQNAAELAFYLPGHPRPVILQKGSLNHQYRFWNRPAEHAGQDAVLVVGQDWEVNEMREMFASVEALADHEFFRQGVLMRRTRLFIGRRFQPLEP